MTNKHCPICGKRKAKRNCARKNGMDICSLCCVEIRGEDCGKCQYYADAVRHQTERLSHAPSGVKDFVVEINEEAEIAVNAALDLAEAGKVRPALAKMTDLTLQYPHSHEVCFGMGVVYVMKKEPKKALEWFDMATDIFPYFVDAYFNKIGVYQSMLDVANTLRAAMKVVGIGNPEDEYVVHAESLLRDMGKHIREHEGVSLDDYLKAHTEFERAFQHMEKGEWLSALEGFRASARIHDRNAPCHGNMGICLSRLGQKAAALAEFDKALEIDPTYEPAKFNRRNTEKMEEGKPLPSRFASIDYGKEKFLLQP